MTSSAQDRETVRLAKPKRPKRPTKMTMLMVTGDFATTLKDFRLPDGAGLAIVSASPKAVAEIKRAGPKKFGAVQRVYANPLREKKSAATAAINQKAFEPDARSLALLDGVRIAQDDLHRAGGAFDLEQVRSLMRGISRQAIDKRVQECSLLAVPGPSNRRSFPTLQFNRDGSVVEGLKVVLEALPTSNPWTILNFLAHPDDRLAGRKPIDVLKAGDTELVVEAARLFGQQGA